MRWIALAGALLIIAAGGWWVLQVTLLDSAERSNASSYGQFVLAFVGILVVLADWAKKTFTRTPPLAPDLLADQLATAMRNQWEQAARDRRLLEPAPLPIRWRRSTLPVAVPVAAATTARASQARFGPLPGLTQTTSARLREGNRRTLHDVYGGLASGRLVIAGPAGSGKSAAAILLLLDALRHREQNGSQTPVPVMFTLHGWDPVTTPVKEWLIHKLTEIPVLRRGGAASLLNEGRIAVFLDGLDEIPQQLRAAALRALSDQASFRLVLLTRTAELVDAAQHTPLVGAAAVDLQPISRTDAADYLLRPLVSPPPTAWQAIADDLIGNGDSPLARALDNPLTLTLLRDVYQPTGPVNELLDTTRFPTPEDIENHLLDHALVAAYRPRMGQPTPKYSLEIAQRTLSYIASRLNQDGSRDLSWWTIPRWTTAAPRIIAAGLIGGLTTGLLFGAASWRVGGPVGGLVGGTTAGLLVGSASGFAANRGRSTPIRASRSWWRGPFTRIGAAVGLASLLVSGVGAGLLGGLPVWLAFALVTWLAGGFVVGIAAPTVDGGRTQGPIDSWLEDAGTGWMVLTVASILWAASGFIANTWGFPAPSVGLGIALALALESTAMLGAGPAIMASWPELLAQAQLALQHGTPRRLMRFLEDARERQVLRTVGPIYQFRHAKLQDRLALLSSERNAVAPTVR